MSKVKGKIFYAKKEQSSKCEICGTIAELRPYGKNGENICFKCAMKDEETTKQQFAKRIENCEVVVVKL